MGKNQRHKKKLKSEKAKVHITSKTKFLPKGQNITNTSFKIKPIIVHEQLKEKDKDVPLSKKKCSVNELMPKLKHYNQTIKVETCQDLKDLIKHHKIEAIQTFLSPLIQNASGLMQDRERKVRKSSISLLNEVFVNISSFKLEPFFNYILINLKCAMTNIDKNIQEDSLLLLDELLEHQPQLIATSFEKIFPDFLTLISKLRSQTTLDRTLTLNLGSKITSVKWRIKVLSRLHGLLNVVNNDKFRNTTSDQSKPIVQKANVSNCIPILKNSEVFERCPPNLFKNTVEDHLSLTDRHVTTLIPLLYETWMEAIPEKSLKKAISDTTVLSGESAVIFNCVVKIVNLLYEYFQLNSSIEELFKSVENKKFLKRVVSGLPYGQNKPNNSGFTKDFSKLFTPNYDQHCVEENLIIINLFIIFKCNLNSDFIKQKLINISSFLNKCLTSQHLLNSKNMKYFVKILKELLLQNCTFWYRRGFKNIEVMNNLIKFYDERNVSEDVRNSLLEILTFTDTPYRYERQQEWLNSFPKCLCASEISAHQIDTILKLCRENNQAVQDGTRKLLKDILYNLPKLKIINADNRTTPAELSIVYIFFYLPKLTNVELNVISHFIQTHETLSYSKMFQDMLDFKLNVYKHRVICDTNNVK